VNQPLGRIVPQPSPTASALLARAVVAAGRGDASAEGDLLRAAAALADAEAAALLAPGADGAFAVARLALDARSVAARAAIEAELRLIAAEAAADGPAGARSRAARGVPGATATAAAAPDGAVIALLARARPGAAAPDACGVAYLAAAALAALRAGGGGVAGAAASILTAGARDAAAFAEALRAATGARLALVADGRGTVTAMAPAGAFDPAAPLGRRAEAALARVAATGATEILDRGRDGPGDPEAEALLDGFAARRVAVLRAAPAGARRTLAVLLVAPAGPFDALDRAGWAPIRAAAEAAGAAAGAAPPGDRGAAWRRRAPALAAAAVALGALALPAPDRIRAEATLEPEARRFVTAAASAVLATAPPRPGTLVAEGEAVGALDDGALALARAASEARRREAEGRADAALRDGRITAAELARFEAAAAAAETALADWRLARLTLRAPVAGVVLSSPFEDASGAPVREGDALLEIASLDRLRLRIDVPAADLARLQPGAEGLLRLDGVDGPPLAVGPFTPAPRAEAGSAGVVLPLTAVIANPDGRLRPGQIGVVTAPTGEAPLGEILFRRARAAVARWLL
jgi:hypothetical protein